jgi:hypothetical protein
VHPHIADDEYTDLQRGFLCCVHSRSGPSVSANVSAPTLPADLARRADSLRDANGRSNLTWRSELPQR